MATVPKRPLTAEEIADAQRLKTAWNGYKRANKGASQEWLSTKTGIGNQSLINQYLNGGIPLNVKALLAICKAIDADPHSISKTLTENMPQSQQTSQVELDKRLAAEIGEIVLRYAHATQRERELVLGILRDNSFGGNQKPTSAGNET